MRALKYSDVVLVPQYSSLKSRGDASTTTTLTSPHTTGRYLSFDLPVVPANMKAVIGMQHAKEISANNLFYVMHRFGESNVDFCRKASQDKWALISISVGVKSVDREQLIKIKQEDLRVDCITIDVAHGHSILVKNMLRHVRDIFPNVFIIAGNVATPEAVKDLVTWGADCVKVGIGQGQVCITKDKTGFTYPMFTSMQKCSKENPGIPLIADGGIRCHGDIAKALVAGASMVMIGSLFSQCVDSPAPSTVVNGKTHKQYFGSASEYNKKEKRHIEGILLEIPSSCMKYQEKYQEIKEDLQSAISYAGGTNLSCFKNTTVLEI